MKTHLVSKDADDCDVVAQLIKASEHLIKSIPSAFFSGPAKDHMVRRLNTFLEVSTSLVRARSTTTQVCILFEGNSFFEPTYLEVQLVDRKNTTVYAAATLDNE